jgi:hypothetical protein
MKHRTKVRGQSLFESSANSSWDELTQQQQDRWADLEADRDLLLGVGWLPQRGILPVAIESMCAHCSYSRAGNSCPVRNRLNSTSA